MSTPEAPNEHDDATRGDIPAAGRDRSTGGDAGMHDATGDGRPAGSSPAGSTTASATSGGSTAPGTITAADLPPAPPASKRRGFPGLKSMILSLLLVTALLMALYAIVARPEKMDRLPVDAVNAVKNARQVSGVDAFSALDPLPAGWKANNAQYVPGPDGLRTWLVGYVHDDTYAGLKQTKGATSDWFVEALSSYRRDGSQQIDGATWERWADTEDEDRVLVRRGGADTVSTIVTSSRSYDDAAAFVARLTPKP